MAVFASFVVYLVIFHWMPAIVILMGVAYAYPLFWGTIKLLVNNLVFFFQVLLLNFVRWEHNSF